jgi:5'-phosphate synthase pdxT subunit
LTKIGVLALQGDYEEHISALRKLDVDPQEVRLPEQLNGLDGLIIPGGESTTQARLMDTYSLREPLKLRATDGMALWGTCAGLIMMSSRLSEDRPDPLGLINLEVQRNGYGRQVDSFEADIPVPVLSEPSFRAIFIRAPRILKMGPKITVLATHPDGGVVAAQEGRMLVTTFHPELTDDVRFHQHFLGMVDSR